MTQRKVPEQSLSVQKAIAILKEVGAADSPISTTEIVARVGYGKTVVLRILATLLAERMIERDPYTGGYFAGSTLVQLAQQALQKNPLILQATPALDEIVRITGDAGLLMVLSDDESLCIAKRAGTTPIRNVGTELGTRSPIHAGGGPFALLAFSDDAFIDQYLSRPLKKLTERTVVDPAAIRQRIAEARQRGFTIGNEDLFEYIVAVGVPIRDSRGKLLGSLSIGGIAARYPSERCIEVGEKLMAIVASQSGKPNNRE